MSLLTTIQRAADWIGVPRPSTVVSSTDQQVRQLYAFANEEGDELARGFAWQILLTQDTFTTVASPTQSAAIPADWLSFVPDSMWNRSLTRPVFGPISPQDWQIIQANGPLGTIDSYFRVRGGNFLITPTPAAGNTIAYEYVSLNWCADNGGTPKSSYTADNDVARLSERLISMGIRWRFKAAKGLDYAEDMATYEREKAIQQAKDKGLQTVSLSRPAYELPGPYIPEGNFPA